MPDDDRNRRRLGDATRGRIADLAEGWSVDSPKPEAKPSPAAAPDPAPASGTGPRKKPRTVPPPPPGSAERAQLEQAIVEATPTPRPRPVSGPPPVPERAKSPSRPPSPPPAPPPPPPAPAARASDPNLTVPIGEFEHASESAADKLRVAYTHATVVHDAADALLKIPAPPEPRGDPTTVDTRGDATAIRAGTETKTRTGGRLRTVATLRRQRGLVGDMRYVFTALFGVRRARRELGELEHKQIGRQTSRRRHLTTLGRTAIGADTLRHAALGDARDALGAVEDERSKHAGAVAAADAELDRVRRDREAKIKQHADDIAKCDGELTDVVKRVEPLEKDAAAARKRADDLRSSLARIDKRIAETEASLVSVKGDKDPAAIQAELASLRADRRAVQRDEPTIAAELDGLNPRIAALEAARVEAQNRRRALDEAEADDKRRTAELLDAIGAKRKVVDRAAGEAETARDKVLFELGERLYVDRHDVLAAQLAPIDHIDLELGETDRKIMELREILSNVDRAKLARGALVIAGGVLVIGAVVGWIVYLAVA
ncbi:MAG TPA: hypothetical protein VGF94_08325 [Kofleriaceae bacterium]